MKIIVLGSGAWALALSDVLANNGNEVIVYTRKVEAQNEINLFHTNKKYLGELKINSNIVASTNLKELIENNDTFLMCIPSVGIENLLLEIKNYIKKPVNFINATKGLEPKSKGTIQTIIKRVIEKKYIKSLVSILGPGFAKEVIERNLTCVCSVSTSLNDATFVQKLFSNEYFRVYTCLDVNGAELYSSMKNAIAIASGIVIGLGYKENSKACLITRGLKEMRILGSAYGAKESTFYGLTGMGDLILTCSSFTSRNFKAGYKIGQDDSSEEFLKNNKETVEGLATILTLKEMIKEKNLDLPIINALYEVIYNNKKPSSIIKELMKRPLKYED